MIDPPTDAPRTGEPTAPASESPASVGSNRRRKPQPHHRPAAAEFSAASDAVASLTRAIADLVRVEVDARVRAALAERSAVAELLTVKQAAAVAQVAPATLRRWIRAGYVKAHHAWRAMRIKRADLERFLFSDRRVADDLTPEQLAVRDFV